MRSEVHTYDREEGRRKVVVVVVAWNWNCMEGTRRVGGVPSTKLLLLLLRE